MEKIWYYQKIQLNQRSTEKFLKAKAKQRHTDVVGKRPGEKDSGELDASNQRFLSPL